MYGAKEEIRDMDFAAEFNTDPAEWLYRSTDISDWPSPIETASDLDVE